MNPKMLSRDEITTILNKNFSYEEIMNINFSIRENRFLLKMIDANVLYDHLMHLTEGVKDPSNYEFVFKLSFETQKNIDALTAYNDGLVHPKLDQDKLKKILVILDIIFQKNNEDPIHQLYISMKKDNIIKSGIDLDLSHYLTFRLKLLITGRTYDTRSVKEWYTLPSILHFFPEDLYPNIDHAWNLTHKTHKLSLLTELVSSEKFFQVLNYLKDTNSTQVFKYLIENDYFLSQKRQRPTPLAKIFEDYLVDASSLGMGILHDIIANADFNYKDAGAMIEILEKSYKYKMERQRHHSSKAYKLITVLTKKILEDKNLSDHFEAYINNSPRLKFMMLEAIYETLYSNKDAVMYLPWPVYFMLKDNIKQFRISDNVKCVGLVPLNRLSELGDDENKKFAVSNVQCNLFNNKEFIKLAAFLKETKYPMIANIQDLVAQDPVGEKKKYLFEFLTDVNQDRAIAIYKKKYPLSYMFFRPKKSVKGINSEETNVSTAYATIGFKDEQLAASAPPLPSGLLIKNKEKVEKNNSNVSTAYATIGFKDGQLAASAPPLPSGLLIKNKEKVEKNNSNDKENILNRQFPEVPQDPFTLVVATPIYSVVNEDSDQKMVVA